MKFLNFFKTTLGITILILAVITIIIIYLNWDAIKAWWSSDSGTGDLTEYNNCNAAYVAMNDADLRAALVRDMGLDAGALNNQTREQLLVSAEDICRTKYYPRTGEQRGQAPGTTKQACITIGGDGCSYLGLYVPCSECLRRGIAVKS